MSDLMFSFDDMLILPSYSETERGEIDITSYLFDTELNVPIISAPMDTITGNEMMKAMRDAGGFGFHHRYCELDEPNVELLKAQRGGVAVSPSTDFTKLMKLFEDTDGHLIVTLDVAHGDTKRNLEFCEDLVKRGFYVVSGNIATADAALRYINHGVSTLKVGIGAGSVCSTRIVTGIGVPQAYALASIREMLEKKNLYDYTTIISDGGHKNTGDIAKAFVLGADLVMLGGMLAGTSAVPSLGKTQYRGMASTEALSPRKDTFLPEGVSVNIVITHNPDTIETVNSIASALEQTCYYTGSRNISELQEADWDLITTSSFKEGLPHFK